MSEVPGKLSDKLIDKIDAWISKLELELRKSFDGLGETDGKIDFSSENILDLEQSLNKVRANIAVTTSEISKELTDGLREIQKDIADEYKAIGAATIFGVTTNKLISALTGTTLNGVLSIFAVGQHQIQQYIEGAIIGGVKSADMVAQIGGSLKRTAQQAQTAVDTALHAFHRSVTLAHGLDVGITEWAYVGPRDDSTREWCGHWAQTRATAKQFESTSTQWGRGKQPGPVMVWGGGWRCRHRFVPVVGNIGESYPRGPR